MKFKALISVVTVACLLSFAAGCESKDTSTSVSDGSVSSDESSTSPKKKLTAAGSIPNIAPADDVKKYSFSQKGFLLDNYTASLLAEKGWEIFTGGTATDNQSDHITSYPAVLKYLDTKDTITITVAEECEDKDSFLAGTKDTYIEAYGSAYESIEITDFQQITIDEFDSFKVKANVVIGGEKYAMTHIISNDVYGNTYSWMLLDSDGKFSDYDIVNSITYPKIIDSDLQDKLDSIKDADLDDYYKVHRDN